MPFPCRLPPTYPLVQLSLERWKCSFSGHPPKEGWKQLSTWDDTGEKSSVIWTILFWLQQHLKPCEMNSTTAAFMPLVCCSAAWLAITDLPKVNHDRPTRSLHQQNSAFSWHGATRGCYLPGLRQSIWRWRRDGSGMSRSPQYSRTEKGSYEEDGGRSLPKEPQGEDKLHGERFHLNKRSKQFTVRTITHWRSLRRAVVESASPEVFQMWL